MSEAYICRPSLGSPLPWVLRVDTATLEAWRIFPGVRLCVERPGCTDLMRRTTSV